MNNPIPLIILLVLFLAAGVGAVIDEVKYDKIVERQEQTAQICVERGHVIDGNGETRYWGKQQAFVVDSSTYSVKITKPIEGSYRCQRCGDTIVVYGEAIIDTIWRK